MSRLSNKDRTAAVTAFYGPLIRRVLHALDNAEKREGDLKARLVVLHKWFSGRYKITDETDMKKQAAAALDLRNKNWRKS